MKISTILNRAADHRLSVTGDEEDSKERFSCLAIVGAAFAFFGSEGGLCDAFLEDVFAFLDDLGLDTGSNQAFREFEKLILKGPSPAEDTLLATPESQSVRYAWLKFAAQVAREEGL